MAYTASSTATRSQIAGRDGWRLTITETDAAASSETEIVLADKGLPAFGRIIAQKSSLTAGSGATVDPILGEQTDPSTGAWRVENATAAADIFNVPATGIPYGPEITSFFHRSNVNTGADNSITTVYYIRPGWAA